MGPVTALLTRPAPPEEPPSEPPREPWRDRLQPLVGPGGWWATLGITLLAGLLRFVRLDIPDNGGTKGKIFDEIYYACDAQNLLRYGVEHATKGGALAGQCIPEGSGSFVVHPPLGKWAIALGMKLFGANPFGWRFMAAVAGTLTVLMLVRVGRRLTGSTLLGCLAGLLLAVDGLHFVQSRVAMLDVFLVFWTTAAFGCLVVDRDQFRQRLAAGTGGVRLWRVAAGVCLGAGLATKWSAVYYLAVLGLLTVAWEVGARRTAGDPKPFRTAVRRSTLPLTGTFVLVPIGVYIASWTGWFVSDIGYGRNWAAQRTDPAGLPFVPDALRSLWNYHAGILRFHQGLTTAHAYESHPVGWLLLARPVSYYYPPDIGLGKYGCEVERCAREVLAIGNPVLWWGTLPVLLALLWLWVSRRDWRAAALLALIGAGILPWIRDDLGQRTMFIFYALPAVPFMALAAALVAGWLVGGPSASRRRRRWGIAAAGTYAAAAVGVFAFFYPVLAAVTIPFSAWQDRIWLPSWI